MSIVELPGEKESNNELNSVKIIGKYQLGRTIGKGVKYIKKQTNFFTFS